MHSFYWDMRTLDHPSMIAATDGEFRAWIHLIRYCLYHENSGILRNSKTFCKSLARKIGVSQQKLEKPSPLWEWQGDDLVIKFYPLEKQEQVHKQKAGGAKGAARRWRQGEGKPAAHPVGEPIGNPSGDPVGGVAKDPMGEPMEIREDKIREDKSERGEPTRSSEIPSLEEVRTWAAGGVGVDPEYAAQKWAEANENHAWVKNGRVIDWRSKWKRWWEEDRTSWLKKNRAAAGQQKPEDRDWWWTCALEELNGALTGALLGKTAIADRLREIYEIRKKEK